MSSPLMELVTKERGGSSLIHCLFHVLYCPDAVLTGKLGLMDIYYQFPFLPSPAKENFAVFCLAFLPSLLWSSNMQKEGVLRGRMKRLG